jgi:outer membrane protein OmpA-like peptidoglycan-associated protein/tetratricopeptide (TPR) repeat protein
MKNIKLLLIAIIAFSMQFIQAQDQDLIRANRFFERTFYSEALPFYESAVKKNPSMEVLKNLSDCYFYTGNMVEAERWYRLFLGNASASTDKEYYFRHAQSLKAMGKYEDADAAMKMYFAKTNDKAAQEKYEKEYILLRKVVDAGTKFDIENLKVNTKNSEFGGVLLGNTMVFSGTRSEMIPNTKTFKWNNESYLDLKSVSISKQVSNDEIIAAEFQEVNTKMHESNAVFTKDGKTMYFTRNNYVDGKRGNDKNKVSNLQIFKSELKDNKWQTGVPLPFNSPDFSNEHPALSLDEKTLYFASDRPGSLGSFDIYSVSIEGNKYGEPTNLGDKINTYRREQFPFMGSDEVLYFSSDGHLGLGLLDVFAARQKDGAFLTPVNVGLPVNSGYDDFAFNLVDGIGFVSSNRTGGKGGDDIYGLSQLRPIFDVKQIIRGTVVDEDSKLPIENATVTLQSKDKKTIQKVTTSKDGKFSFPVEGSKDYNVVVSKKDFANNEAKIKTTNDDDKDIDLPITLKSTDDAVAFTRDKNKKDAINQITTNEKDIVVKDKDNKLVIQVEPIYFDLNLWDIREDSKQVLDKVLDLMKKYPKMVLEIRSHTDNRASDEYNMWLSGKRARATRNYLRERGISKRNVFAKGYGESQPTAVCEPQDSCTEDQHQQNRRSEFVIKNL